MSIESPIAQGDRKVEYKTVGGVCPVGNIVLKAKREEFIDDALIYAKSLCEEFETSFEPQDESEGSIYLAKEVKMFSYRTKMT
ncbi:hypothetical protein TNCV_1032111 [Trichonephila clavipes]|nr:hypothetical protein TNCV_1032111 [Trichonephila clavipes]